MSNCFFYRKGIGFQKKQYMSTARLFSRISLEANTSTRARKEKLHMEYLAAVAKLDGDLLVLRKSQLDTCTTYTSF